MGVMWPVVRSTRSHPPHCQCGGLGGFLGQAVVDAEGTPDYEQAVGYFMSWSES